MYFIRTVTAALNTYSRRKQYEHFESIQGLFYNLAPQYYLSSINGFAPDLNHLPEDFRMTRFVRDPRDLIVSGYFYHKRGAEPWFRFKNPTEAYWSAINGHVPDSLPKGASFSTYLKDLSIEEGLLAEMKFRKYHLESMLQWSVDTRIKVFKYEDIMRNQVATFKEIVDHLAIEGFKRKKIMFFAKRYAIDNRKNDKHIRNPNAGQWKQYFTPQLNDIFLQQYAAILDRYGYPLK